MGADWDAAERETAEPGPMKESTPLINLHFMASAVKRHRWLVAACALVGLLAGVGFAVLSPAKDVATTSVLLTRDVSVDPDRAVATDLALAATDQVAGDAAKKLKLNVAATDFAKDITVTKVTDDVLRISVSGPTQAAAKARANAVATAFLQFRSSTLTQQAKVTASTLSDQIAQLNSQINALTTRINDANSTSATALSDLIAQRSQATSQISTLQDQVQSALLSATSISATSRVLDPATTTPPSKIKRYGIDGAGGFFAGGALAILVIIIGATISWRVRRREDMAEAIGAPVRSLHGARRWSKGDLRLASDLVGNLAADGQAFGWISPEIPKSSTRLLSAIARDLAAEGQEVLLVDLSGRNLLKNVVKDRRGKGDLSSITTIVPDREVALARGPLGLRDSSDEANDAFTEATADYAEHYAKADVVLVLAYVDPALGAEHLRSWIDSAVISVAAGASTPERLNTTAELLRVAGIRVRAGFLLDADRTDESLGMPFAEQPIESMVRAVAQ